MVKNLLAGAMATVLLLSTPVNALAFGVNIYPGFYVQESTSYHCVPASALLWTDIIKGLTDTSHATQVAYLAYAQSHDKCSSCTGTDPRGWAWILYHWTPAGYGFNDYRVTSQGAANWDLAYGVRATYQPTGALVANGRHAIDVVGFTSSFDPFEGPSSLYGFYLVDPWYGRGNSGLPGGPYGFTPNTYVTLTNWNANYFWKYTEGTYWNNYYVVVPRASTDAAPSDSPPLPYGDVYQDAPGFAADEAAEPAYGSGELEAAVLEGLVRHQLTEAGGFATDLEAVALGHSVLVESAARDLSPYLLVELQRQGETVAVAMVSVDADGLRFAGVRETSPGYQLPDARFAADLARDRGLAIRGSRLIWGWSDDSASPFMPFVELQGRDGGFSVLSPAGWRSSVSVYPVQADR